jgi:phage gp29-like protein
MPRPPSTEFRAQSGRALPSDSWTPDLIRLAETSADAGNLRWAADLCDALLGDDRVQGAREKLAGLLGLPLAFEDGAGRMRRRAKRFLEAEEDWWDAFSDESLVELLTWGVLLGVALANVTWTERRGRVVPKLTVWHPRALRWDAWTSTWRVRLFDGTEATVTPGDGSWVVFTPRAESEPWKHGAWRAIARWWRAKRYALADWGKHSEQAAGLKVASTEDGTDADRAKLAGDLSGVGGDAAVALPPKWKLDQLGVSANTKDVFDGLIDAADDAITIALLGQNLTTEAKGGSFAAATVHQAVALTVLRSLASSLAGTLHAQVLVPWATFNFGNTDAAPWPVWAVDPPVDRKQAAEVFEARSRAAATIAERGAPVDWRAFAAENDIPLLAAPSDPPIPAAALSARARLTPADRRALAGQVYVDAVHDAAMGRAPAALAAGILGAVQRAIAGAEDYESLRAELAALVKDTDDGALQELLLGAVMCCAGAGTFTAAEPGA